MGSSCDLLCSAQRKLDLGTRCLLRLLHESPDPYVPPADRRDIERAGYSVAACQPQFPQLLLQMLHVRLAQAFEPCLANALGKPQEPCLHVRRKGGDFSGDGIVQNFNSPRHVRLYLNYEIEGSAKKRREFNDSVSTIMAGGARRRYSCSQCCEKGRTTSCPMDRMTGGRSRAAICSSRSESSVPRPPSRARPWSSPHWRRHRRRRHPQR